MDGCRNSCSCRCCWVLSGHGPRACHSRCMRPSAFSGPLPLPPAALQLTDITIGTRSFGAGTHGTTNYYCDPAPSKNCSTCANAQACVQVGGGTALFVRVGGEGLLCLVGGGVLVTLRPALPPADIVAHPTPRRLQVPQNTAVVGICFK